MIGISEIVIILFSHWLGEYLSMTNEQREKNDATLKSIVNHSLRYSLTWVFLAVWIFVVPYVGIITEKNFFNSFLFVIITFVSHGSVDYIFSSIKSKIKAKKIRVKNNQFNAFKIKGKETTEEFINIESFSQFLHLVQIFTTYIFLFKTLN